MKRSAAVILCIAMISSACLHVHAESSAMDEWLKYAREEFEQYTIPEEVVNEFLNEVSQNPEFSGMSYGELCDWLDEAVLLQLQDPDIQEEGILSILNEAAGTNGIGGYGSSADSGEGTTPNPYSDHDPWPAGALGEIAGDDGEIMESYIDGSTLSYISEDGVDTDEYMEYVTWLADYVKNVIEPQAVEKLLQIPAFGDAALDGLLSRYLGLSITYDPYTSYDAMVVGACLDENGNVLDSTEVPVCNAGRTLLVNISENGPKTRTDDKLLMRLEDTVLHEMTHAFMYDMNRNGMLGTDKTGVRPLRKNEDGTNMLDYEGSEIGENKFPLWFAEGTATSVQAGYSVRRNELLGYLDAEDDREAFAETITSREEMMRHLKMGYQDDRRTTADLIDYGSAYSIGYVACMYLYSAAAQQMGLEVWMPADEGDILLEESLINGMSRILQDLKDGKSLDQIIAQICTDPETGEAYYADTDAFEDKFCQSVDDPGLIFWQNMMAAYERDYDESAYEPTGSILPGYEDATAHYLTGGRQDFPIVYEIVPNPEPDKNRLNFPLSTVRPSKLALGGGRSISYDPEEDALSDEEREGMDVLYTGDRIEFVSVD